MLSFTPLFLLHLTFKLLCANSNFKNLYYVTLTCLNCSRLLITVLLPFINFQVYIILAMQLLCPLCKSYKLFSKLSSSSLLLLLSQLVSLYQNRCSLQYQQDIAIEICLYTLICNLTFIYYILASYMIYCIRSNIHFTSSTSSFQLFLFRFSSVY